MNRFKNILLIYRGLPEEALAIERAENIAQKNKSRLTLFSVFKDQSPPFTASAESDAARAVLENLCADMREALGAVASPIAQRGIAVSTDVAIGTPFFEIIRKVLRDDHDLVILTAEGKRGLRERLFGSTPMHLMRKCPCPVWTIKPSTAHTYKRILAAVDITPGDKESLSLSRKILELATSLARIDGSSLHIVHAWELFGEQILRSRSKYNELNVDKLVQDTRQSHAHHLNELLSAHDLTDLEHQIHLVKGEASDVITDLAQTVNPELIIMGTVSRTGLQGFLIGNTAEQVLYSIDCSVLTVKPDGFESPITLDQA